MNNPTPKTPPRRSSRERKQPVYYGSYLTTNASRDKAKWKVAMETEMKSLEENDVWNLVKL